MLNELCREPLVLFLRGLAQLGQAVQGPCLYEKGGFFFFSLSFIFSFVCSWVFGFLLFYFKCLLLKDTIFSQGRGQDQAGPGALGSEEAGAWQQAGDWFFHSSL